MQSNYKFGEPRPENWGLLSRGGPGTLAEPLASALAGGLASLFKIKDVTIDAADKAKRTVAVSFGGAEARVKLVGLPLAGDISIRGSFLLPGSLNHLPFKWERLEVLVGKQVSMHLKAEASGLTVASIAAAND